MKNVSVKLLGAAAVIGITAAVYSFTSDNNPDGPEFKKYEVIRMVDGEVTTHDTIIDAKSDYSPESYLADLGYGNDENVNIINLLEMHIPHIDMKIDGEAHEIDVEHGEKMIFIEMNEDGVTKEEIEGEEGHEIRIEKKVIKSEVNGEEEVNIEIDVDGILESINIDSIIASAMEGKDEGNGQVVMQKVIVMDEEHEGEMGDVKMEFHEMDVENADYHKKVEGPGHKMEIAVWNDGGEQEDFTMVIISDPSMGVDHSTAAIELDSKEASFKLYPNPAKETSQLQLSFDDMAPTAIRVTDVNGKVVAKLDLGDFSGQYTHELNVKSWSKGVYMVQVQHGNDKMIEKLIVE